MYKNVKYLLFDLGGVLVELTGTSKMLEWMNKHIDRDKMNNMWLFSPSVRAYEMGNLSTPEFVKEIINEFEFNVSEEQFTIDFKHFINGFYEGAKELLDALSKKYKIACLSNTNEIHWDSLCEDDCISRILSLSFPSFKTGYMKPDKEAYLNVIDNLGCKPIEILFFDDNKINVDAAIATGMNAIWVHDFNDMKKKIENMGII